MATNKGKVTIAIEGCCHGELDKIYSTLQYLEKAEGKKVDLLISCGDFQAVRNLDDLETMACPVKYRSMNTFYKYYSGEKVAPIPTLFIGGNHEASNHLWELYYGGWAAPNIYFMGFTGVVQFAGLRIGGLSGIYKSNDYYKGHYERLPYNESMMRSMYHVREFEHHRLNQIQQPMDIFLSHDWPKNVVDYGDRDRLLARKTFLRADVESGELGSVPAEMLLHSLKPSYWFSAHLHTKFAALVPHDSGGSTRFLALDKCLPGRDFLQVLELDARGPCEFHYDEEWLSILRTTAGFTSLSYTRTPLPIAPGSRPGAAAGDVEYVKRALEARGSSAVPNNFVETAPAYNPRSGPRRGQMPGAHTRNPQTVALLDMLGIPYDLDHSSIRKAGTTPSAAPTTEYGGADSYAAVPVAANPEEIDIGEDDVDDVPDDGDESVDKDPMFSKVTF